MTQFASDGTAIANTAGTPPTIRGSAIQNGNANAYTVTFPGGAAAGDLAVLFIHHGWNTSSTPSGWSVLSSNPGTNVNGYVYYKTLSSGDISTGSVTINFAGTFEGEAVLILFTNGTWSDIRLIDALQTAVNTGSASSRVGYVGPGMSVLTYAGMRANGSVTVTYGTSQQNHSGTNSSCRLTSIIPSPPTYVQQAVTFATNSGIYFVACVVIGT